MPIHQASLPVAFVQVLNRRDREGVTGEREEFAVCLAIAKANTWPASACECAISAVVCKKLFARRHAESERRNT